MGTSKFIVMCVITSLYGQIKALENLNESRTVYTEIEVNGRTVLMPQYLLDRLQEEQEVWHWMPWMRTRVEYVGDYARELAKKDSIDSFPNGIFSDEQLRQGAFLLYAIMGIYAFSLLAVVVNYYFIPCVELICDDLKIPQNVAAATFMSVATSCPEFFVNLISTFLTESDMGIGTIVGSALFNALGVGAIGGLAAIRPIPIGMRPVTRDVIIYLINVSLLVGFVWDGQIDWYEAMVLTIVNVVYFIVMFNSMKIFGLFDKCSGNSPTGSTSHIISEGIGPVEQGNYADNKGFQDNVVVVNALPSDKVEEPSIEEKESYDVDSPKHTIWKYPNEGTFLKKLGWFYFWPIKLILSITIPHPQAKNKTYLFSFVLCILWIGVNSYFVSWSMTVIGYTFLIPDSVMGMTFLAFGGCLPESFSIFIMSRRGEGGIGISNALGANSLAILFALGTPWFIKNIVNLVQGAEESAVLINSTGIEFVVACLFIAVVCLWITLFIGKFTLRKTVGFALLGLYCCFITLSILIELNVLLDFQ